MLIAQVDYDTTVSYLIFFSVYSLIKEIVRELPNSTYMINEARTT